MDGIGVQLYTGSVSEILASNILRGLQNMNVQGLPTALTEFGTFLEVSPSDSATVLNQAMRMMFGNASSTGFLIWDWTQEDAGVDQWAPGSALYTVNTSDWNSAAITPAGQVWQDLLGIHDWDGNPNNGWNTQLTLTAGANGTINFNGFYGEYEITVGNQTYDLNLSKGVTNYVVGNSNGLPGDFNQDGRVDSADYTLWRNGGGDQDDYLLWKTNFGRTLAGGGATAVPEAGSLALVLLAVFCGCIGWRHAH